MSCHARVTLWLHCTACGKPLRLAKKDGERFAVCVTRYCPTFGAEYFMPTAELITQLLKTHLEEKKNETLHAR